MNTNNHSIESGMVAQVPRAQVTGYTMQPATRRRGASPVAWMLGGFAVLAALAVAALALWFAGLGSMFDKLSPVTVGDLRTESHSVPLESGGPVAVNVDMGQGTLVLTGGATDLLNADFNYNVAAWKPEVTYSEVTYTGGGTQGTLNIEQVNTNGFARTPDSIRNDWNLRLKAGVPFTIRGDLGAGTSILDLRGLSVSKLDLSTGAGATLLDLTGPWKQNLNATLHTGVGDTTIKLPKDVGVRLKIENGVGNVDSGGLTRDDSYYTNAAFGKTPFTLEIDISSGVSNITLQPER